jgi:AraC-like DNA-binding protein
VFLSAEIRRKHGMTIGEFVRTLRVEFACRELAASDASLAAIAPAAASPNQAHFARKKFSGGHLYPSVPLDAGRFLMPGISC